LFYLSPIDHCLSDSAGNDRIVAGGCSDIIYQERGGDDWILGGEGRDGIGIVLGVPSGNDIIEGGAGADLIWGGDGNDQIFAENSGEMEDVRNSVERIACSVEKRGRAKLQDISLSANRSTLYAKKKFLTTGYLKNYNGSYYTTDPYYAGGPSEATPSSHVHNEQCRGYEQCDASRVYPKRYALYTIYEGGIHA
jgi:Ca2+-binding RTX toxin-like protein